MKCRVSRLTYEFHERELQEAIATGTPEDVCRAARGLIRHCFTRRSLREWMIDSAPEWVLAHASRKYRAMDSPKEVAARSEPTLLTEKVASKQH